MKYRIRTWLERAYYAFVFLMILFCLINTFKIMNNTNKLVNDYTIKVCGEVFVMPSQDITAGGYK